MNFYAIPPLITAILLTAIGLFVFFNNKTSRVNIIFTLFCFSMVWWLFGYTMMYLSADPRQALNWARIGFLGIIFIPILAYHFIAVFLDIHISPFLMAFLYLLSIPSAILSRTDLIYSGILVHFWGFYPVAGKYYILFLMMFAVLFSYGVWLLFTHLKKSDVPAVKKHQIMYVLLAFGMGTFGIIDYLAKYAFVDVYPFGYVCALLFIGMIAYAIIRHHLMDIEVVIKKTLVFATLFSAVYAVFVMVAFLAQGMFFREIRGTRWISLGISVMTVIVILRPLENFLIHVTDKYLFQKKYDYRHLLRTFTNEVLAVMDVDNLLRLTVTKLAAIIKITNCAVLLLDEEDKVYKLTAAQGIKDSIEIGAASTLTNFLSRTHSYLLLSTGKKKKRSPIPDISGPASSDIARLNAELIIPLALHDEMIGMLTLGKKKSDEAYTGDDIDILVALAQALAIGISNARLFVELSEKQTEAAQNEKMAVIGMLSAGINHEICNPLGIARGQCETFLLNMREGLYKDRRKEELLAKAQEIMEKVIHETSRATAITKRLASFAKPSTGVFSYDIDIKKEIDEVLSLIDYELKLDKITLALDMPPALPFIAGDRKQIQEIFFNLLRNTAQAISERGMITVRAKEEKENVLVEIESTGPGIPLDKLEQVFRPFYTTKPEEGDRGLGLFIVRQIVERNKGKISVSSSVNKGTVFTLEFPGVKTAASQASS